MSIIFKGTLTVYFLIAVVALSLLSLLLIQSQTVYAEEETPTQSATEVENPIEQTEENTATETADIENQTPAFQFGNYTYRAEKGDNLTYFARRSIQLYLQTSEFNLQTSQIIAAETLTVQELGAFELTVGQEVEIEVSLIGRSVYDAYLLDEVAKIRWSAYEPIRESLDHIEPLSAPQTLNFDSQEPAEEAEEAEEEAETTENEEEETLQTGTDEPEINNAVAENDASFYVTMLGVLILIGIVAWVLALSFLRNTKEDGEDIKWEEDDKSKLKEKITNSKLAEKVKTLPRKLDEQKEKLKKKSSKPKKVRKKILKKKK